MGKNDFCGKKIAVIGAGESGLWATKLLLRAGASVKCSSQDRIGQEARRFFRSKRIAFEEKNHRAGFLRGLDAIVTSPGVRPSSFSHRYAKARGLPILSELEAASRFLEGKCVAVTGTNGKTTVCNLLSRMVRHEMKCDLCGNVGKSLSRSILSRGPKIWRVLEVSSFQLHYADAFKPSVAVVLNLRPNHLDWHKSLAGYYRAKTNIARNFNSNDPLVLNADDPVLMRWSSRMRGKRMLFSRKRLKNGIYLNGRKVIYAKGDGEETWADLTRYRLLGPHNAENVLATVAASICLGISKKSVQRAIDAFRPLHHRIETLGKVGGVSFVNDSKSTTVDSTRAALSSFGGKVVLVAGGRAKERDFRAIKPLLSGRVSFLVLYGESRNFISRQLKSFRRKVLVERFRGAVLRGFHAASPGDTLLLSPMCASFDQFDSYQDRGDTFKRIYQELREVHGSDA